MSLLRPCQRTILKQVSARPLARLVSTEAKTPAASTSEEQPAHIVPGAPTRDIVQAEVISGAPAELRHRQVRIFQPPHSTTQSGTGKSHRWRIDWEILQGGGRWENPLMGWASSADYMQGTRLSFRSKEDAVHFAEKQGWDYFIEAPELRRIPPKNYAENYVYKPNKLRICRTK